MNIQAQEPNTPESTRERLPHSGASFQIRPAGLEDMQTIVELVRSSAEWYRPILEAKDMAQHEVDEVWARENFARRDFYLGLVDETPMGVLSIQRFRDYAYLGYLYLDVEYVGCGYGAKLMRFGERLARRHGAHGMCLIAHPDATWAKRAYLKYGFEIVEHTKEGVLAWQGGVLRDYYEEGFQLYLYEFESNACPTVEAS
jgi:GNAT superfamily N-acetyltransferase